MRTVEVRSNIAGDIVKIRKGVVYKDTATVVDELLQNCQRAKATLVDVRVSGGTLVVMDDGAGCPDPQALFEKNTSAWGNEDEAFGEGFFSVFLLADKLEVRSCDWSLTLDVLEMLRTQDMHIEVTEGLEHVEGMIVQVSGEAVEDDDYELRQEVEMLAQTMDFTTTLNGQELEKVELFQPSGQGQFRVESDLFEGCVMPTKGYGSYVQWFYEGRPVRSDYVAGVSGNVAIKKGCATLKAPDRKEFIYDDKRERLFDSLKAETAKMFRQFILTATDEELDALADAIDTYLKVSEYADLLSVSKELFERNLHVEGVSDVKFDAELLGLLAGMGKVGDGERRERPKGLLAELVSKVRKLAYVPARDIEKYEAAVRRAEYLGFTVVYAPNQLYVKSMQHFGVPLVTALEERVAAQYIAEKDEPRSQKELRFLALMRKVEQHFDMPEGTIRLASLRKEETDMDTGEVLVRDDTVLGMTDYTLQRVYIDRRIVKFPEYRAQDPEYPTITAHDYKVLLRVWSALVHEIAHLLYLTADNTKEHEQAELRVSEQLAEVF